MSDDASWLDGNAIAGLLDEVFGTEMTTAERGCQSCSAVNAIGAHRVFQGAGIVVRCPACGDVAMRIVTVHERHIVELAGTWTLVA
jgi:hypothetical protein